MGKGAPSPPDPYQTAAAQSGANRFASDYNFYSQNINEYSPYGSKTYTQTGTHKVYDPMSKSYVDAPIYTSNVKLSPAEQELLNKNTAMRGNIGDIGVAQSQRLKTHLGKEMDTSKWQAWQAAQRPDEVRRDETATDRGAIEKAMMERYQQNADPRNEAMRTQMAARGMSPGSQGYGTMQKGMNDEFANATRDAYLASGQESRAAQEAYNAAVQQKYALGADWAAQLNQLRQAQAQEGFALRNQPINEIMSLLGASGPNTPQFQPFQGSSIQAPNIGQYIYDQYNAKSQQASNNMSGLFGLGSAAISAAPALLALSDRRLKTDIKPLHQLLAGVPLYSFRYRKHRIVPAKLWGSIHIGVMADEVRDIHPDAVRKLNDGFDRVDYALLRKRHLN